MNQLNNSGVEEYLASPNDPVHIFILLAIMLAAGILGGITGFMIDRSQLSVDDEERKPFYVKGKKLYFEKGLNFYLLIGICASLLVPLFMSTISSELLSSSRTNHLDYFVFGGFCLVASISAHKFIISISDKVLRQVNTARDEIAATENRIHKKVSESEQKTSIDKELTYLQASADKKQFKDFTKEKAFSILDKCLSIGYSPEERTHLLDSIVRLYFQASEYELLNEINEHYSETITPNTYTWANISIANMILYRDSLQIKHREKSEIAAQQAMKMLYTFGEPYMYLIYLNLIDYSYMKSEQERTNAFNSIKDILARLYEMDTSTIYSAYNYLSVNDGNNFKKYNDLFRKIMPDEYLEFKQKASENQAHEEIKPNISV
ncbi:MAG: hypothetical protein JJU13_06180 [Balneolaceae bacterium]|nr:hypothetical protein [Balneolaceae bacterium]